jgi:hypothetical protein
MRPAYRDGTHTGLHPEQPIAFATPVPSIESHREAMRLDFAPALGAEVAAGEWVAHQPSEDIANSPHISKLRMGRPTMVTALQVNSEWRQLNVARGLLATMSLAKSR